MAHLQLRERSMQTCSQYIGNPLFSAPMACHHQTNALLFGQQRNMVGSFAGENRSQQISEFQDKIEGKLSAACGPDAITCIGNAVGIYCAYVDFIAWDLDCVLNMAKNVFDEKADLWTSVIVGIPLWYK